MSPTLYRREECDNHGINCPSQFRPTNYAIIIAGIFIVFSLASCFVIRNRRRRSDAHPRLQHYSNGPAHIAEFIRLPPPPADYVPHAPYQIRQQRPVFEPAPPYDPTKGPPSQPLPPSLSSPPPPTHTAPTHDPPGGPPPPQAVSNAAEIEQRGVPGGPPAQINVPPVEYPPPSYSRV